MWQQSTRLWTLLNFYWTIQCYIPEDSIHQKAAGLTQKLHDTSVRRCNWVCVAGYFIVATCIASFTRGIMNGRLRLLWQQCTAIQLRAYSQICCLSSLECSSWDHMWPLPGCGSHWQSCPPSTPIQATISHFFHRQNFMISTIWSKSYTWTIYCYSNYIPWLSVL